MKDAFLKAQNQASRDLRDSDPNRLAFHLMPPTGWLNDPNGLCQIGDEYHIFYQYAPEDPNGSSLKGWGHYTTRDFRTYKEEDIPLLPGSEIDKNGAYSGSAFQDGDTTHFFYTGNGKLEGDHDYINSGRLHWTNHFETRDGKTFSKKEVLMKNEDYPENLSCHVRDPKILKEADGYYMVLGARTLDSAGQINVFKSQDLKSWKPVSVISTPEPFGYMWECPDLFDLDGKRILITCPQGLEQKGIDYENIYQNGFFLVNGDLNHNITVKDFEELDRGFDFYAPQTFEDNKGRRILIGWMGMPDAEYDNEPTVKFGWQHALTLPRELHYHNGRLYQYPVDEILQLRKEGTAFRLEKNEPAKLDSSVFELILKPETDHFEVKLRKDVTLAYEGGIFSLDLGSSGQKRTVRHVPVDHIESLDIFSDTSSLEIFINGGQQTMTTRVYDSQKDLKVESSEPMEAVLYPLDPIAVL